ncbi:hypothetical protein GCM10009727_94510 [Actinomadura napierensis]|uniref:Uncharacterized protein n=1 Tax=Actinomadura napierensis TaxID=267854 RepID=A0ABN3AIW8_9ACTN
MRHALVPLDLDGGGRGAVGLATASESEIHGLLNCVLNPVLLAWVRLGKMEARRVLYGFLHVLGCAIEFCLGVSP